MRRQFDEKRLERTFVPAGEDVRRLARARADPAPEDIPRLCDELHVGVFDAVVNHLHEVPGAIGPDVRHARPGLGPGGDRFEDVLQLLPRFNGAARHQGRAVARPLLAARHPAADEMQAGRPERGLSTARVFEPRVAAINHDVARIEQRLEPLDRLIDRRAGGDQHHDPPRPLECRDERFEGLRSLKCLRLVIAEELIDPLGLEVPDRHRDATRLDVEREVATHRAEADYSEL